LKDLAYPLAPELPENDQAAVIVSHSRELIRDSLLRMLVDYGFSAEDALVPPGAEDDASVCYCPRCGQQFEMVEAVCDFCGGRSTQAFS
jgi:hypothetical protein